MEWTKFNNKGHYEMNNYEKLDIIQSTIKWKIANHVGEYTHAVGVHMNVEDWLSDIKYVYNSTRKRCCCLKNETEPGQRLDY